MIHGEDLRLGLRALLGRPAESLLLAMAVALAVAASVVGITLAGTAATVSQRWLLNRRSLRRASCGKTINHLTKERLK